VGELVGKKVGSVRKRAALAIVWSLIAAGFVTMSPSPAPAAPLGVLLGDAEFSGFAHGANVHADAVTNIAPATSLADVEAAFSGAAVDAQDFDGAILNETGLAIVPDPNTPPAQAGVASGDKEAYGKGTGLEVGLGTPIPNDNANQIVLGGRAAAGAIPPQRSDGDPVAGANDTGLVQTDLLEVPGSPLIYAEALLGEAQAQFDDQYCITGANEPLAFGRGQAAKAQLLDTAASDSTDDLDAPLVNVATDVFGGTPRAAADSQSFAYLVENLGTNGQPDGTWGLATETHMTFAPIELLRTSDVGPAPVTIEILGEWVFRAVATGKPGGSRIDYEVLGPSEDPDTPVIRIWLAPDTTADPPTIEIKRSDLFGDAGINIPAGPLLDLTIGEDPRAISPTNITPDVNSDPLLEPDGTEAAGAADVIRLDLLSPSPGPLPGPRVAGVRIGHLEARAEVPSGGINCPGDIDVVKQGPSDTAAGAVDFPFTITCDDGTGTRTFTLGIGETEEFNRVPAGTLCTVDENPPAGWQDPPNQSAVVQTNVTHELTFTNERNPGTLTITKDAPADAQDVEFDFAVDCGDADDDPDSGRSRSIIGDGTATPITVPAGETCTVHEFTEEGFASQPDQQVTIVSDQTSNVTFVNERVVEDDEGALVVAKDAPADAQQVDFDFTVTCGGDTFTRTVTGDGLSEPVAGIDAGTVCTVHEEETSGFVNQPDQTATIVADETVTVTFVNQRVGGGGPLVGGEVTQPNQPTTLTGGTPAADPGTQVRGVQITRQPAAAAQPVTARPRFTG
jgi:hypothetical protein